MRSEKIFADHQLCDSYLKAEGADLRKPDLCLYGLRLLQEARSNSGFLFYSFILLLSYILFYLITPIQDA